MKKCEMFLIKTYKVEKGGCLFCDSKEDKYIYCPVTELKYLIDNENDKSVIEWYYIKRAYRMKGMTPVESREVFGK